MGANAAARARRTMVDSQLKTVGVIDDAILAAMASVPREAHLPPALAPLAYSDAELEVAPGRWLLEPLALALLLQTARLAPADRVLIIGGAGGYSAAIVAACGTRAEAVESDPELVAIATAAGVAVHQGELTHGWPAAAPYSLILFEGAIEVIPDAIADQLADGGRVAAVVRAGNVGHACAGPLLRRADGNGIAGLPFLEIAARPLPGFARRREFAF
ncbi:hypothetical protein IP88_02470 [alpha proteobacterium AAP81b]|nr:hypothetical protein IP88_02470 [alpha proteobacterium AAP81b]